MAKKFMLNDKAPLVIQGTHGNQAVFSLIRETASGYLIEQDRTGVQFEIDPAYLRPLNTLGTILQTARYNQLLKQHRKCR